MEGTPIINQDSSQATATALGRLYAAGETSPVEALETILSRVERLNPRLNALTLIDREAAFRQARASEGRWRAGAPLSPLDGVPVSIQELIKVAGWPLTMGSLLTDKAPVEDDAPVVSRLRESGAVIFAQSTSPEYGFKGVTDSPLNGITRNPWNTDLTPGGSSGGAGAAVAARLGPLAIGTDGGGSVRIPASFCGLVGFKATYGRIPAWPASMHGDLANTGPLTRSVADCALMMDAIARPDIRDPFALPDGGVDYLAVLDRGVSGLRIGLIVRFGDHPIDPGVEARVRAAARQFGILGAHVEEVSPPFDHMEAGRLWSVHWLSALQRLLQVYPEAAHDQFDPVLLAQARTGAAFSLQTLVDAQVARRQLCHAWNLFFGDFDLLISPTVNVAPWAVGQNLPIGADGQPNYQWAATAVFNLTRHPAITLPCGLDDQGLPVGLQIISGLYKDAQVISAAAAFEATTPPSFPAISG